MDVVEHPTSAETAPTEPRIYEAALGSRGSVIKGRPITRMAAEIMRRAGRDIVVCGPDKNANGRLAFAIENSANVDVVRHRPHTGCGPNALPHWQPASRPPEGHSFYETPNRKAF